MPPTRERPGRETGAQEIRRQEDQVSTLTPLGGLDAVAAAVDGAFVGGES